MPTSTHKCQVQRSEEVAPKNRTKCCCSTARFVNIAEAKTTSALLLMCLRKIPQVYIQEHSHLFHFTLFVTSVKHLKFPARQVVCL